MQGEVTAGKVWLRDRSIGVEVAVEALTGSWGGKRSCGLLQHREAEARGKGKRRQLEESKGKWIRQVRHRGRKLIFE